MCTVDNDPNSGTFGDVSAGASANHGDVCTVSFTASAAGYNIFNTSSILTIDNNQVLDVTVGFQHSCALIFGGRVKCWGRNDYGQLGLGDTTHRGDGANEMGSNLPFLNLGSGKTAVQLSAWYVNTCAILNDGSLKCWGRGDHGQLGLGDILTEPTAPPSTAINLGTNRTASMVSVGGRHICAILDNGAVKCWGRNHKGQLGIGNNYASNTPQGVNLGNNRTAQVIRTGADHTCAILDNDSLVCWGANSSGQLGIGNTSDQTRPQTVSLGNNRTVKDVFLGHSYTCAIWDDDSVKCWGANGNGQLGQGNTNSADSPSDFSHFINLGDSRARTAQVISGGEIHVCGILDNDELKCWGSGAHGRLGSGSTNQINAPGPALNLGTGKLARKISSGGEHTCALLNDHTVKCWGRNGRGQLGAGDGAVSWGDGANEMGDNLPIVPLF